MNTNFKHKILAGAIMCGALLAFPSCDDSELMPKPNEKKLYQLIKEDPELTDFIEVINSCGEHCLDSLFNKSRVYTVWAPVNDSFDKEALIEEVEKGNREHVFKTFVMSHVANHRRAINGEVKEKKVLLLNGKYAVIDSYRAEDGVHYTFEGMQLEDVNVRAWNGLLHKLSAPAEYRYNIWEYLRHDSRVDSVANYLYSFDVTDFSEGASLKGPIVNGQQTYIDSVFVTTNSMLSSWGGVGQLKNEDSTYTVYVPTNEVWQEMTALAEKHFQYNDYLKPGKDVVSDEDRDSLRRYHSTINVIKYMTYSDNEQRHLEDPRFAMPAWHGRSVFDERPEFEKDSLDKHVIFTKQLSNGTFKIVDKLPYTQFDLWHDTIEIEVENSSTRNTPENAGIKRVSKIEIDKDSIWAGTEISGDAYYRVEGGKSGSKELICGFPNVLSANYELALVFVPEGFPKVDSAEIKPTYMEVSLVHNHLTDNDQPFFTQTISDYTISKVDTLFLTDEEGKRAVISVPYCEYYDGYPGTSSFENLNLRLKIKTIVPKVGNKPMDYKKLDVSLDIDEILLIPVKDSEE